MNVAWFKTAAFIFLLLLDNSNKQPEFSENFQRLR